MSPRLWISVAVVISLGGLSLLKWQRATAVPLLSVGAGATVQAGVAPATPAGSAMPTQGETPAVLNEWTDRSAARREPAIVSEWARAADRQVLSGLRTTIESGMPGTIPLSLGPGRDFAFAINRIEVLSPTEGVASGEIAGIPGSTVVLSYVGDAAAGTVHLPATGRAFNLYRTEDGRLRVIEIDLSRAPDCPVALVAGTAH